jgi:hypothetical protein
MALFGSGKWVYDVFSLAGMWTCAGIACSAMPAVATKTQALAPVPFSFYGSDSKISKSEIDLIESDAALLGVWARHAGRRCDSYYREGAPLVDYHKFCIVAAFLGRSENVAGVAAAGLHSTTASSVLRLQIQSFQTGPTGVAGTPYAFIVVPKRGRHVVIEKNVQTQMGQPPIWKHWATLSSSRRTAR